MRTSPGWSGNSRLGINSRRTIAAFAAFVISMTSLGVGAIPAVAAPGDADLVISKTANSGSALVGTAVEFNVTVTNSGPGDTTGVDVTDALPTEFSFLSASATTGSYNDGSGVWSIGAMSLGAAETLTITARAESVALATNTATISASDQIDPNQGNNSATAAVNIVTVPPAVCDTDDIIGISGNTIYSINTRTGVATAEFQTSFNTGNRNALASNRDLGMVYWGSGSVVYWWNPIDDTEGVLVDLTGQINGTLESAGATYHGGYYYFSTEISGNANGIYRIAIDSAGTKVVPGSLEQLAPNQPEDGLEAVFNRDMRPDYGDLTVLTVNGEPVMFGSVVDGFVGTGYWWSYNINSGTFSYIAQENNPNHVQLGTDLEGDTWGTAANGDLYSVNVATGELTFTGHAIGIGFYDLSGSFCVPPELADIDLDKTMIANADEDGSASVTTGDTLTYQLTATNTGNVVLTGVTISDPLPGMGGLSCSKPMPAGISSSEALTCTATYTVTTADQQNGNITNIASVVGTAPSGATVSDTASEIVVVAQPEVVVTKTADVTGPVVAGQVITYTVIVDNTGVFPIDDISIVDPLPAGTSYVDESTVVTGWTGGAVAESWSQLVDQDIAISNSCSTPTNVTFVMPGTTDIADVDLGFTATHGTRGQIRATLTSPSGTTVVLASGNSSDSDDNYDVLFDGDSTGPLDDNSSDDVTPADYERSVGVSGLESLAGGPAAGTWTLAVCDTNPFWANGTFNQATLFIDGVGSTTSTQVKDNVPGGAQPDLAEGVPPVLVDSADDFDLPVGESMTITYEVQVDDQLDGSVTEILNEAMAFSESLPPTTGYVTDPVDFRPEVQVVKTGPAGPVSVGETVSYTYTVSHAAVSDGSPVDVAISDDIIDLTGAALTGDGDGDGLLDGNETWVYAIDYAIPVDTADPLVNVATVTGNDGNGEPISDVTDDHSVDVDFRPALTVTKAGGPTPAMVGGTVTYTYTVSHSATSDLSPVAGVTVVDSRGLTLTGPAGDTNGDNLLDGDETWIYTATETITPATPDPLTNDVTVDGTDPDGDPIPQATDSETVDINWAPLLQVDKTGYATARIGETVTYTFSVSHHSASDGSPVTIDGVGDDVAGAAAYVGGDDSDGLLEADETWIYEAGYTVTAADPDPLVNTVTVTSTDLDGETVPDATDTHSTDIDHMPAIVVGKTGPAAAVVGDSVTYTFAVYHDVASDGTPVSNLTVVDDVAGAATYVTGDDGDGLLEAGETWVFTATYTIQDTDPDPLVNVVTVTGDDEDGDPIGDTDTHSTDVIQTASVGDFVWHDLDGDGAQDTGEPGLDGVTINLLDPVGAVVATTVTSGGGSYSFTDLPPGNYTVDVDEATLPLTGAVLTTGSEPLAVTLAEGEDNTDADFGYYEPVTIGDLVWDDLNGDGTRDAGEPGLGGVTVRVFDDPGNEVGSAATAGDGSYSLNLPPGDYDVVVDTTTLPAGYVPTTPANVNTGPLASGDTFDLADFGAILPTYPISGTVWTDEDVDGVLDTTELPLTGVTVELVDDSDHVVATTITQADGSYGFPPVPNGEYTVSVDETTIPVGMSSTTGNNPEAVTVAGAPVGDVDFGYAYPGTVAIDKNPATQQVVGGGTATFDITVTNPGPQDLTGVVVTDPAAPDCDNTIGALAAGASTTYSCALTGVNADFTNTATVSATDEVGNSVTDSDSADVDVIGPAINIQKTPDQQTIFSGDDATFTITVANTGDVGLSNVTVTDVLGPDCETSAASLAVGAVETYTCTVAGVTTDFTNTAFVTGDDPLGNPVSDSDTADVEVINPAITISKTPDGQQVVAGDTVTFDIIVTNTGDVDLSGVTVTDALAPDCDNTFPSLAVGASHVYSCTMSAGATDFTNTADVTGDDPLGHPVTDTDTADVDVIDPAITIDKTPDLQQAIAGSTVTFDITVTNTGDVDLSNVAVTDAQAPGCVNSIGVLGAGASTSHSCTMVAGADDFTNTVSVTGDDPLGNLVTDSDTADVDVVSPAIDVAKNPATQTILAGATATFSITVTNTGNVPLDNVVVTDAQAPSCNAAYPSLAAGENATYNCTLDNVTTDFTNVAVASAEHPASPASVTDSDVADVEVIAPEIDIQKTPDTQTVVTGSDVTFTITVANTGDAELSNVVVTDAAAPACGATLTSLAIGATETYDCTVSGVTADFTNVADVAADDPSGGTVTDTDDAIVDVIDPAVRIDKTPDRQTVLEGDDATFAIMVTNTGDADLTNVAVTDTATPSCDSAIGTLSAGETVGYDCIATAVATGFTNVADVTGTDPLGNPVADSDDAVIIVSAPAIEIVKTADTPVIISGADATFTITVTNVGTELLTGVTVTDALAPDCDATIGDLSSGESTGYSCTLQALTADLNNTAEVAGTHPFGGTVTDSDTADVNVITPAITITKTADETQVLAGQDATFTITVENTGDVPLTGVVVTDPAAPGCDATIGDLALGDINSYPCTVPAVTADFTNTASVVGFDSLGNTVGDSDDADIDVISPAIDVDKAPDNQFVTTGGDATFTITVTNTGDVDLTDVTVTDPPVPACDATIGDLAAGDSTSYSCDATGVTAGFTNTVSAFGTHPAGGTVTDSDTADVVVINPAIALAKDPALQQLLAGEDASFTITVINAGDSPLTDVAISDPQAPGCETVIPSLGVGASQTVSCTVAAVSADFTNTASVVATTAAGGTVTASDSADVVVLVPQVDIQKTPDTQLAAPGSDVTFTITVTNAGVVPLIDLTVTDPLVPACDTTIPMLAVGESTSYDCTDGVTSDFTNVADVTATDTAGNPATDGDTADVDVVAPAITITKTPDLQSVGLNGTPTFTISVINTGDIDLANVVVTDTLAPACDAGFASLPVGATETYMCDGTVTTADFTNTASASADSAVGPVSDSDTADVTVLLPGIDIQKTPETQRVGPGGTATFTVTVTNAGATPLANIVVSDPLSPACDAAIPSLAIGASTSYDCDVTGVTADFTNTASVTAADPLGNPVGDSDTADVDFVDPAITVSKTPDLQTLLAGEDASFTVTVTNTGDTDLTNVVVGDPLAPGCGTTFTYLAIGASETATCTVTGVMAGFTNVASATADTPIGSQVSDSDDALVEVVNPGVEIQKTPDIQQVHSGDDVTFTITVTNTGDDALVDLSVTDGATPACDTTIAALAVGESTSYDCTATGITADFTNIASVAGTDVLGNPVSDSDDALVDVISPALDVQKTPDIQAVVVNGTVTFSITVANTGDVNLTGVTVTDPLAPNCDATIGALAVGESSSFTCSVAGVAANFTNTVDVSGVDPIGATVSDSDTADVTVVEPGIEIQKTPDLQQTRAGDTVDFTITVTNTGGVALSNVTVTDTTAPACGRVIGVLAVGETTSYACSTTAGVADFTNTADVTGDDPIGNAVTDSDNAEVDVIAPAISIRKSPDGQTVVVGGTVSFTIEVANIGDVDLTAVTVTDALVPACDGTIGDLAVGESTSYSCTVSDVTTGFSNTAVTTGTDPIGLAVTDSDTADVTVLEPDLDIQKTPDIQTVVEGGYATFTIIVTNTGQTDLFGVTVTDLPVPACDNIIGNLPVGAPPVTYTCTVPVTDDFTNTATVDAVDPLGNAISDEDSADVVALGPGNISGTIAHDVAGDGVIDGSDRGLGGIPVIATWAGPDGVFGTADDEEFNTNTSTGGDYDFDLVPPGEYEIVVDTAALPNGVNFQTVDPDGTLDSSTTLTLAEDGSATGIDFAYTATGSIGDTVFLDLDGNGAQDAGEPGIGGVDVTVTWFGPDGVVGGGDDLVFTATTGPVGTYLVDGLPAGDFGVVISNVPEGLTGATRRSVTLAAAEARDDVDFPLVGAGAIGDEVFEDLDRDGVFDAGEPGIAGVGVYVTWAGSDGLPGTADDIVFTTVTDAEGRYLVELLPAGDFVVEVDDTTIPVELGTAPPVTVNLGPGETDLDADFPLVGNRPPVAVDDSTVTDEDTAVVITVLDDDSDPDGHDFAISDTTDPLNGTITVNPDATITYTPNPGFVGVDTFTYTICEVGGAVNGVPATGLCDTATVTVTIAEINDPPGPEASFQSVVVGDPLAPMPVFDPDGGPVTVRYISGDLPPGITLNDDGSFSGVTEEIGTYQIIVEACDDDVPQICIIHTHTIAVTPTTLPGPEDPPGDDGDDPPPDTLPFTGANFGDLVIAALLMLSAGAGMLLYTRKRRQH